MTGPPRDVAAVRVAVRRALADLPAGTTVLVACSGGADSLALAAGLAWEAARSGRRAGAVVVDHGLQPGSAEVAAAAAVTCRDLGLDPVRVVGVRVGTAGGPEAAARAARYAALETVAQDVGAAAVLLGHTLDDQAETVLLALARGSGERALAGMRPVRGLLRRPLLGVRRAQTEAACAAQGLVPWQDPTNGRGTAGHAGDRQGTDGHATDGHATDRHGTDAHGTGAHATDRHGTDARGRDDALPLRSRVRRDVLPVLEDVLGPGVAQALARTADALAEATDTLDELATQTLRAARRYDDGPLSDDRPVPHDDGPVPHDDARPGPGLAAEDPGAGVVLDVDTLSAAPTAVRRRALHAAAVAAGCPPGALARVHLLAVDALVTAWRGQGPVHLPGGRVASRACGRLYLGPPRTAGGGGDAHAAVTGGLRPGGQDDQHDDRE